MGYFYHAFGLNISSELQIPEFLHTSGQQGDIDIQISFSKLPGHIEEPVTSFTWFEISDVAFLLRVEDVGNILVENGNKILIEKIASAPEAELRQWALGPCLAILLHQRGLLALHAGGIQTSFGAVLFTGDPGYGKSTLVKAFVEQDYKMISDDLIAVEVDRDGRGVIYPSSHEIKLWENTENLLGMTIDKQYPVRENSRKFSVYHQDALISEPVNLNSIFILDKREAKRKAAVKMNKTDAVFLLIENTFGISLINDTKTRDKHFDLVTRLVKQVPVYQIYRTPNTKPKEVVDLINNIIKSGE